MAARHGLLVANGSTGVTAPQDGRLALAGLLSAFGAGPLDATAGIIWGPGNPFNVTGSSSGPTMKYVAAAGYVSTARGATGGAAGVSGGTGGASDGLVVWANDAPVTTDSGSAAPSSGTRWDLIWCRHKNSGDGFGDANSDPEFGVVVGTAGATPSKPYASVPAGALVLAEASVGTSIANASLAVITMVAPYKVARGCAVPVRNVTERNALSKYDGLQCYRLDTNLLQITDGTNWEYQTGPHGSFTGTITSGTDHKDNTVAVPFPFTYSVAPEFVQIQGRNADVISYDCLTITTTGFLYRAFLTPGANAATDHAYTANWRAVGGS